MTTRDLLVVTHCGVGNRITRIQASGTRAEPEKIFRRERNRAIPASLRRAALRKLLLLDAADSLEDLRVPPGNRLEKLKGDRRGQHSIRSNQQYRICFTWTDASANEVEIVDYH